MAATPGSKRVGGVYFEIEGDDSDFRRTLRQSETQAKRAGNVISAEFRKTEVAAAAAQKRISGVGTSLIAMAAAAGLGIGQSVSILKDFGQAMSTVQAVTGATEAQMVALTAQARLLGATTRFSATQAAEGMIFLARAGFSADQALGAIEGTLQLAQAGALDLGRAADIASNVLSGFNLPVSETARVVDVLAKAANSANTDVNQLGEAMKFAAPTAVALGLGLEETTAIIGKLSDAGIQGGLAGRGFQSLATQFENQRDKIEALIGPYDLAVDGISNVIKRLNEAGITTKQVIEIFRAENLDVFTILKNAAYDSAKGIDALNNKLLNARGTAAQVAKTMDDNLNG
ncbi:MAG TPA: phage tail tape measure protein, partial [Hyphomonas sp.]|nr:phage tail tape measure protein [Hyphomonas sp.]